MIISFCHFFIFFSISHVSLSTTTIPSTQHEYDSFVYIKNDESVAIGQILTDALEFSTLPIEDVSGIEFCFDLQKYRDSTIRQPLPLLKIHHLDIGIFDLDPETGKAMFTFLGRQLNESKADEGDTCVNVVHSPLFFFLSHLSFFLD